MHLLDSFVRYFKSLFGSEGLIVLAICLFFGFKGIEILDFQVAHARFPGGSQDTVKDIVCKYGNANCQSDSKPGLDLHSC